MYFHGPEEFLILSGFYCNLEKTDDLHVHPLGWRAGIGFAVLVQLAVLDHLLLDHRLHTQTRCGVTHNQTLWSYTQHNVEIHTLTKDY